MDEEFTVEAICLFCNATLTAEENRELKSGDLIKCDSCGELNDYDSIIEVAKEKGLEKVNSDVKAESKKSIKGLFK